MHYIREDVLCAYVLSRLQYWSQQAQQNEEKLLKRLMGATDRERSAAKKKQTAELRKAEKRKDAASLKEKLEGFTVSLVMPAGPNGKLYGAVTNQTVADELHKNGFDIERKRIEIAGNAIKTVGKYHATVRLYEAATAELKIEVISQEDAAKVAETAAKEKEAQPAAESAEA